jgi:hypothetical protein
MDQAAKQLIPPRIKVPGGTIDYGSFEAWFRTKYNWTPCPGTMVGLVDFLEASKPKTKMRLSRSYIE